MVEMDLSGFTEAQLKEVVPLLHVCFSEIVVPMTTTIKNLMLEHRMPTEQEFLSN